MKTTDRFCDRADDYAKYRPSYPIEILSFLEEKNVLKAGVVADIGSGTGIFSKMLLDRGYIVYAVEPNADMRAIAEEQLHGLEQFFSVANTGESTGLPDKSMDAILLAQAFHWLDHKKAKGEFLRILKNRGPVIIIWNDRDKTKAFGKELECLIERHATDFNIVSHRVKLSRAILSDFFGNPPEYAQFDYAQELDLLALLGRLASCSYLPKNGQENFLAMKEAVVPLFEQHQVDGHVTLPYVTRVYWGFFT